MHGPTTIGDGEYVAIVPSKIMTSDAATAARATSD